MLQVLYKNCMCKFLFESQTLALRLHGSCVYKRILSFYETQFLEIVLLCAKSINLSLRIPKKRF